MDGVVWESFVGGSDSMGIVSERTVLALDTLGVPVFVSPWNVSPFFRKAYYSVERPIPSHYQWDEDALAQMHPRVRELTERTGRLSIEQLRGMVSVVFSGYTHGSFLERRETKAKIGYFFCDYTSVPSQFVSVTNRIFDHVSTVSSFPQQVLQTCGVKAPITVWHHGVDSETFQYHDRSGRTGPYTFLFVGVAQKRKGLEELLSAFVSEFSSGEDVRLIVKSADWGRLDGYQERYLDPRIEWRHANIAVPELVKLYHEADCFVLPSKGDAFGLPVLEAMSTGLPAIVHDWGGPAISASQNGPGSCGMRDRVRPWTLIRLGSFHQS
jgi:glycosyltransferase involved in cell wall biosynthesis